VIGKILPIGAVASAESGLFATLKGDSPQNLPQTTDDRPTGTQLASTLTREYPARPT